MSLPTNSRRVTRLTKATPLKPWLVKYIQCNGENQQANAVKIIECISGPDSEGNLLREVTDGEVFIKAVILGDAIKCMMQDVEEDMPSWDKALILIRKHKLKFEPNTSQKASEFVLIVEDFKVWDFLSGFDIKKDIFPCMQNASVQIKIQEHWKTWREFQSIMNKTKASQNMTCDSTVGSQTMLSLLADMGQVTQSQSEVNDTPEVEPIDITNKNLSQQNNSNSVEESPHVNSDGSSGPPVTFPGPTLIDEISTSHGKSNKVQHKSAIVIDSEQPSTSGIQNLKITGVSTNKNPSQTTDSQEIENYNFNSVQVNALEFSCSSSSEDSLESGDNTQSKKSTKLKRGECAKNKSNVIEKSSDEKNSKKNAVSEDSDLPVKVAAFVSENDTENNKSNVSSKSEVIKKESPLYLDLLTDFQEDSIIHVSIVIDDESFSSGDHDQSSSNIKIEMPPDSPPVIGTQAFTPQLNHPDDLICGTQPFTCQHQEPIIQETSDTTSVGPDYWIKSLPNKQSDIFSIDSSGTSVESRCHDLKNSVSCSQSKTSRLFGSKAVKSKPKRSNRTADDSIDVYQSTQNKTGSKKKIPQFPISPIRDSELDPESLNPSSRSVIEETDENLIFDVEYEEEQRLKQLTSVSKRPNTRSNKRTMSDSEGASLSKKSKLSSSMDKNRYSDTDSQELINISNSDLFSKNSSSKSDNISFSDSKKTYDDNNKTHLSNTSLKEKESVESREHSNQVGESHKVIVINSQEMDCREVVSSQKIACVSSEKKCNKNSKILSKTGSGSDRNLRNHSSFKNNSSEHCEKDDIVHDVVDSQDIIVISSQEMDNEGMSKNPKINLSDSENNSSITKVDKETISKQKGELLISEKGGFSADSKKSQNKVEENRTFIVEESSLNRPSSLNDEDAERMEINSDNWDKSDEPVISKAKGSGPQAKTSQKSLPLFEICSKLYEEPITDLQRKLLNFKLDKNTLEDVHRVITNN
ncbi:dentin sialophosphoprotein [Patella vulgata]|uniref:dentin sialophosphoprotein n=1 Tax=Patella vulgata TaxID=6465 RepID=UPI00217FD837|nr:dentin sialophosphoprotein [Patella vulgata]